MPLDHGQERRLADQQQGEWRLVERTEVRGAAERFQQAAVLEQMRFVDHQHSMLLAADIFGEDILQRRRLSSTV